MPIAIYTCYMFATEHRPSCTKASMRRPDGRIESVTLPYDSEGDVHEQAANALRARYWADLPMHLAGETLDGRGYVFTIAPQEV